MTTIDQALSSSVTQATQDALESALDAIEGVREWAGEVAETTREKITERAAPKARSRSWLPVLLVAIGLGAVAFYVIRRRRSSGVSDIAPDAFGAAVEAEGAVTNGERAPAVTPGA